jgi:hypothetical protein
MNTLFSGPNLLVGGLVAVGLVGAVAGAFAWGSQGAKVFTDTLAEPLNGASAAKVEISAGSGNLTIDRLTTGEALLAGGTLEYTEKQGVPARTREQGSGQTVFALRTGDSGKPWLRLPWEACNAATTWQIHLNPAVSLDLTAFSGGGNLKLDLAGAILRELSAETGGGNVDVVLPENAADLTAAVKTGAGNVTVTVGSGLAGSSTLNAKSGAGNVTIHLPDGVAARIHASSGVSKVIIDPRFGQLDKNTYQSPDYDSAAKKIEINASSGAGNVTVDVK